MKLFKEFKIFAMRGNVVDMAVGVIIGGAFGKIVTSLVNDIIMPPIGMLVRNVDFAQMAVILKPTEVDSTGIAIPPVTLSYGVFINAIVNFFIVAVSVFLLVKALNIAKSKEQTTPPPPPAALTTEAKLLTEIRDLLNEKSKTEQA